MSEETVAAEMETIPENVTPIEEAKKPSKLDLKKQQIYIDRMRRHMAAGLSQEAAAAAIAKEDYDRLPVDRKIKRLESIIAANVRGMFSDISALRNNQFELADTMEVNLRAVGKLLRSLGVTEEQEKAAYEDAQKEFTADRAAAQAKAEAEQSQQAAEAEKQEVVEKVDQPGEAEAPAGADTFGG